ncbi:MAG: aromatic ring-hydroxylating dioxygenase subunit alpha [Haliea sp.]|mgnify:FL=1|nr:aromatic ring-hydroxylating dioxygenase subunit alpha [Haliea sp.]MDP4788566.1 aromatic ring-hydroxylating dioxygenase subunit alpha [Haliea sp.]MDP4918731.1 aromatic ring-hydroxylating dioxygenase subunit alpha [Haliea sp.]MDP5065123.1 aromatic ring-hydroxylating dioxygenase subunit alpha [Haliea sp.]
MSDYRYAFLEPGRYARGWHIVAFSSELAAGAVQRLHYFGLDLVLFRGESGTAAVLDAHCPHLGAHLASDGGRIIGDTLACPFHGWTFAADGECVDIPYATRIPERARHALRGWPVVEENGFIALWYDPENGAPEDYLPRIAEWGTGEQGWGDWQFHRSRIRAQPCDVIENIVDIAHFPHVHGGEVLAFENRFSERTVTQISKVQQTAAARSVIPPGLPFDMEAMRLQSAANPSDAWGDATYHGPSIMYYYTESRGGGVDYRSWWVNYHTPVDETHVDLCSAVIVSGLDGEPVPKEFADQYAIGAHAAFGQDVEIWKDKVYRPDPVLCDGDGPINKLRRWYEQFYLPR